MNNTNNLSAGNSKVICFGGDIGHGYTKTQVVTFPSKVKVGKNLGFGKKKKDTYPVVYKGQDYVVGDGGLFTGEDRYFTTQYKLALLTAIALNNPVGHLLEVKVAIGVPIERHSRVAKQVADHYRGMQEHIKVGDREVTIIINDITVFIEGAYPVLTGENGRVITIDMGAGTINVTEFMDGAVDNYSTYAESMWKMYQQVATHINVTKGGNFRPEDIEPILNKDMVTIKQVKVDITDIRPIVQGCIAEIGSLIKNSFNIDRADSIYFIGGGASDTFQYWKKEFPTARLVEHSRMINSRIFDLVASSM